MAFLPKFFDLRGRHKQKVLLERQAGENIPSVIQYVAVHQEAGSTVAVSGSLSATISGTPAVTVTSGSITATISGTPAVTVSSGAVTATLATNSEVIGTGLITNPSATITRPANTDAYASGDLVANNTDAGSVTPGTLTIARASGGTAMLRRCGIRKSTAGVTNASFRVHLYRAAPTVVNGDNGAFSSSGSADYLGAFDVTIDRAFSDGAVGYGVPVAGSEIAVDLASGTDIRFLIEARGAYTPGNAETFTVIVDNYPN